jgi:2-hydroxy-3-oxopropionate reductase
MKSQSIAIVGLGQMGARYAQRFIDAGFRVVVWNRNPARAEALASAGAVVAESVADAISAADIIIAALENSAAFEATVLSPEALRRMSPRHLIIDTSTVHPDSARQAAAVLAKHQVQYIDAPVSGGTRGAAEGTLTILVGANAEQFENIRPVLTVLGKPHLLGPTGAGQIAKLVNQTITAVTIGAVGEGLYLAKRAGLDPAQLLSTLQGGFADSRILREHGARMVRGDFTPGAANRIFLKDLNAIAALAQDVSTALPLTARIRDAYVELIAAGHGEQDHSSYFNYLALPARQRDAESSE